MALLLLGSVLPDVPFALLSAIYTLYYRYWPTAPALADIHRYLHSELFFTDPLWIIAHNTPHSLVVNGALLALGAFVAHRGRRWGRPLLWLAAGMTGHALIDVFTHYSDGPLLFFPLNWTYRFASPVSYWEAAHYGREFTFLEWGLNGLILTWFVWRGVQRLRAGRHGDEVVG